VIAASIAALGLLDWNLGCEIKTLVALAFIRVMESRNEDLPYSPASFSTNSVSFDETKS
jgi:hypothetical protein